MAILRYGIGNGGLRRLAAKNYAGLKRYLEEKQVAYREIRHPPAASALEYNKTLGCRLEQQAKCLLVRTKGAAAPYHLVTLPAQLQADLDAVKTLLGASRVRMATRDELVAQTGCQFGELPPVGTIFGIPLVMHDGLLDEAEVYFNAGHLERSFVVAPDVLVALEAPIVWRGTSPEEAPATT